MKKFRLIMAGISAGLILVALFYIDYQNLVSKSNMGAFFGIISMVLNILAMILSNRYETKQEMKIYKTSHGQHISKY